MVNSSYNIWSASYNWTCMVRCFWYLFWGWMIGLMAASIINFFEANPDAKFSRNVFNHVRLIGFIIGLLIEVNKTV